MNRDWADVLALIVYLTAFVSLSALVWAAVAALLSYAGGCNA